MAMDRHRKLRDALDYLKEVLIQAEHFLCSCVILHSYVRKHDGSDLGILTGAIAFMSEVRFYSIT